MIATEEEIAIIREKFLALDSSFNEKLRRIWAATEAKAYGLGGISMVQKATGISATTIIKALKELKEGTLPVGRIRKKGGGRKTIKNKQKGILAALKKLVAPFIKGDPQKSLQWTSKSVRKLTLELNKQGFKVSKDTVCSLLKELGYSLQANKKSLGGGKQVDRDAQFQIH